jgi:hypothetical protein
MYYNKNVLLCKKCIIIKMYYYIKYINLNKLKYLLNI